MICLLRVGFDGAEEPEEAPLSSVADRLGNYRIERRDDGSLWELGRGAMGVTYRALDTSLRRPVALKLIDSEWVKRGAEARERFMREARTAASLRHPNVATVYHFGIREENGQCFCAMELVEGETLETRVRRTGPLDALTTIDIALQVSSALAAAEKQGLVHRDLKPANLMLVAAAPDAKDSSPGKAEKADTLVKVIDFGVAKALVEKPDAMGLTHGGFVGTPAFASPEQFTDARVGVRSDIYSLGATLWYLLTGNRPFQGATIEQIRASQHSQALPIEQLKAARVPSRLVSLLVSMLAAEPAARPDVRALTSQLQDCRAQILDRWKAARRLAVTAGLIGIAAAAFVLLPRWHNRAMSQNAAPAKIPEKSIAILPFENRSEDKENAFLPDGIQDEILTLLSKIADLKVISRTSTQQYKGASRNLREIAEQLGVAYLLEGSVQKSGDAVRVNVRLIKAASDSHLWAETFDRKLTDIFLVESEIAKGIAESLQTKLTGREQRAIAVKPTNNPEAYDAYLRGLAFDARSHSSLDLSTLMPKAVTFYERAVQLDPNFAIAWARLSRAYAYLSFKDVTTARVDATKRALENAQKLEPNLPETLLALGFYQYWMLRDYGSAKTTFGRVSKLLPNSSEVLEALGAVTASEGNWDESVAYFEQALALDPRDVKLLLDAAQTYGVLRQFPTALKLYDRALDIMPNDPDIMAAKATIYQAEGNLQEAARLLSQVNEQTPSGYTLSDQLRFERNYGDAVRLLQTRLAQFQYTGDYDKSWDRMRLALTQRLAGDTAGAKVTAEQARNTLEQLHRDHPGRAGVAGLLSLAYAVLGEKDSAIKLAERAMMLRPRAKDAVYGPALEENLALIQAMFGQNSRAISTLTQLLQTPYKSWLYNPAPITSAQLRLDPVWDSLRTDPRFQKLLAQTPAANPK